MSTRTTTKPGRARRWLAIAAVCCAVSCGEVPPGEPWTPPLDDPSPPDTRPRTFLVRGRVLDGHTPVPRATVRYLWVDRGRLESAITSSDEAGRFELWGYNGQYVPPGTRGTMYATHLARAAFASLRDVPAGGPEPVRLVGSGETATSSVSLRDPEGNPVEHGQVEARLQVEGRTFRSSPSLSLSHRASSARIAAPTLPFELAVTASGFEPVTLGPFAAGTLPPSLAVTLERSPAPDPPARAAAPRPSPIVRDVVGVLVPPRGVPVEELVLDVHGLGQRGVARDGSFLLPALPLGTHVVHVAERRGMRLVEHVSGREWDRSIVCTLFGTERSTYGLPVLGFVVDVEDGARALQRRVELDQPPACALVGRITLDGAPPANVEDARPCGARLLHPVTREWITSAVIGADGAFTIGLDEPRDVLLEVWNACETCVWRLHVAVSLQRGATDWTLRLPTGTLDLEPAWLDGELQPPADFVAWRDASGVEVGVYAWEEDPVTRHRRFDGVPAGTVVLQRRRPTGGARIDVGTATVAAGCVTSARVE